MDQEVVAPALPIEEMEALQPQVDALSARVAGQARQGTNTKFAGLASVAPDIRVANMPNSRGIWIRKSTERSRSLDGPPNTTGWVIVKRNIYAVTVGARLEFSDMSFSRKDFQETGCPHEDQLVITPVIAKFEVGRILVDTGN
ncbi:hypothetical protein LIER_34832 [Lithospermum erythrorhizon]|uniref:Uncharacterized protein n=1 Tax=Lithospermum erythrorhizon TaxID=34254 RepID=A0AAV3S2Q8_LITER